MPVRCPACGCPTSVRETRDVTPQQTRRRRICDAIACGHKFSTVEIVLDGDKNTMLSGEISIVRRGELLRASQILNRALGAKDPP
jgi:hypothetical protein